MLGHPSNNMASMNLKRKSGDVFMLVVENLRNMLCAGRKQSKEKKGAVSSNETIHEKENC